MKKNECGFTLIELLAVILILSIILLIAIPVVMNVMDTARRGSLESTAWGIVKTAEQDYLKKRVQRELTAGDRTIVFEENEMIIGRLDFSGEIPKYGKVIIHEKGRVSLAIHDGKYCAEIYPGEHVVHISEKSYLDCRIGVGDSIGDLINQGYIPIANAMELNNIRHSVENIFGAGTEWEGLYFGGIDKNYIQVQDIDLNDFLSDNPEGWNPIGTHEYDCRDDVDGTAFTGIYNGGGLIIDNLIINRIVSTIPVALFGTVDGAILENINLTNINVVGGNDGDAVPTAGLVGQVINDGVIINAVNIEGNVSTVGRRAGILGGYIGYITDATEIIVKNSMYIGNISSNYNRTGGIIGSARRFEKIEIENTHFVGNVIGSYNRIGGFIGDAYYEDYYWADPEDIEYSELVSINVATLVGNVISDYNKTGGFIGEMKYGESLYLAELDHNGFIWGDYNKIGGIVGSIQNVADITMIDINRTGNVTSDYNKTGGVVGMIREFDDILIQNISYVGEVVSGYNKTGGLVGEITNEGSDSGQQAKTLTVKEITVKGDVTSDYNKTGGVFGDIRHIEMVKISDVYYEGDIYHGYTKTGGLIGAARNLNLLEIKDSNVKGAIEGSDDRYLGRDFGGIVGLISIVDHSELNNVHFEGRIFSETLETETATSIGGLVGRFGGRDGWATYPSDYNPTVNIINSSANAELYGIGHKIGGLIGTADYTPLEGERDEIVYSIILENSFFKGTINMKNGGFYTQVGGLVGGATDLIIKNSYALADLYIEINEAEFGEPTCTRGQVFDSHNISGMVGGRIIDKLIIENSYYAGIITLTKNGVEQPKDYTNLQPITTFPNLTNIINTYYDYSLLSISDAFASEKTTYEMTQQSTYTGWDFDNIWGLDPAINNNYPYLQWED